MLVASESATSDQPRRVERLLNTRPRKTLGYRTPLEALSELSSP
jgi:IS30 family transposase